MTTKKKLLLHLVVSAADAAVAVAVAVAAASPLYHQMGLFDMNDATTTVVRHVPSNSTKEL
jgi:hypothetical protein